MAEEEPLPGDLVDKDAIIEALQTQIEELQKERRLPPPSPPEPPPLAVAPTPSYVMEEEHARLTAAIAQEIKKIEELLTQIEKGEESVVTEPPPPLSLAREIGLTSTGRSPRPSDDENLFHLQQLRERVKALQGTLKSRNAEWSALQTQLASGQPPKPKREGWLQLDEAEVKSLEDTLVKVQMRNEQLAAENEKLKYELKKLSG